MKVLRVERRANPKAGPWNDASKGGFEEMLDRLLGPAKPRPIDRAMKAALREGVMLPSDMPAPTRDTALMAASKLYGEDKMYEKDWYFGFKDAEQYQSWFRTPKVRAALLGDDAVLACYDVPDTSALVGDHQVVFRIEDATDKEILPRDYAIHPT